MTETVRNTWVNSLTECSTVRAALSQVTGTERSTPEHVEVGRSRMSRDVKDRRKVQEYLNVYSPFRFVDTDRLITLSSGVVAGVGDKGNCDCADAIGLEMQKKWDEKNYGDVSFKKGEQVKTISQMINTCSVDKEKVSIDPNMLFHRLVLVGERQNNLRECFSYELTPYPMSLFKDGLMRKPVKPNLYRDFTTGLVEAHIPSSVQYVVDGGYLVHKVRWNPTMDLRDVLPLFSRFVKKFGQGVHRSVTR